MPWAALLGPMKELGMYVLVAGIALFAFNEFKAAQQEIGRLSCAADVAAATDEIEERVQARIAELEDQLATKDDNLLAQLEDMTNENNLFRAQAERMANEDPFEFANAFTADLRNSMQRIEDAHSTNTISPKRESQRAPSDASKPFEEPKSK